MFHLFLLLFSWFSVVFTEEFPFSSDVSMGFPNVFFQQTNHFSPVFIGFPDVFFQPKPLFPRLPKAHHHRRRVHNVGDVPLGGEVPMPGSDGTFFLFFEGSFLMFFSSLFFVPLLCGVVH